MLVNYGISGTRPIPVYLTSIFNCFNLDKLYFWCLVSVLLNKTSPRTSYIVFNDIFWIVFQRVRDPMSSHFGFLRGPGQNISLNSFYYVQGEIFLEWAIISWVWKNEYPLAEISTLKNLGIRFGYWVYT